MGSPTADWSDEGALQGALVISSVPRLRRFPVVVLRVEAHQLNCAEAHPIAPGKSEAFAMRVRVPRNARLGANGLFWELDPIGSHNPQLHARVTIDR